MRRFIGWLPIDSRKSQVVELRYFGGLTIDETAETLAVSVRPSSATGGWRALASLGRQPLTCSSSPVSSPRRAASSMAAKDCRRVNNLPPNTGVTAWSHPS